MAQRSCRRGGGRIGVETRAHQRPAARDAEAAEAAEVVAVVTIPEGDTAGGIDQEAIPRITEAAAHRRKPVKPAGGEAAAEWATTEQGHVAERTVADAGRVGDARARRNGSHRSRREEAVKATKAAEGKDVVIATVIGQSLDVSFDTDHPARARRELIVVADLTAAREDDVIVAVIIEAKAQGVDPGLIGPLTSASG